MKAFVAIVVILLLFRDSAGRMTSPFAHPDIDVQKIKSLHSADVEESMIKMNIDHFNANGESDQYDMRYLVNKKHYKKGGPIFFYAGNEGNVWTFYNNTGFMVNTLAEEFNATVVFTEHRYFGESMPFGKDSYETENLKFLNVEQTMMDYVEFIRWFRTENHDEKTPVIVFGGSYGGMLASWLRMKFPETFQGAIAASAPIIYFKDAVPEDGFFRVIDEVFAKGHPECQSRIKNVHELINNMKNSPEEIRNLQNVFKTCQKTETAGDVDKIIAFLDNAWIYMAMTNYPYPTEFLAPMPGWPVDESCKPFSYEESSGVEHLLKSGEVADSDAKLLQATAESIGTYYNYTGTTECYDLNGEGTPNLDAAGWDILACNEMCMPMGTDGKNSMFLAQPFEEEQFIERCQSTYGITPQFDFALTYFGGRDLKHDFMYASNIVFTNGDIDPWSAGSVTVDVGKNTVTVNIENSAHHLDLRDPNEADPESVVKARDIERQEIRKWIDEYNNA